LNGKSWTYWNTTSLEFGVRRRKCTRAAFGLMTIISERTLEIGEKLCNSFTDWQKAFERA
jgi:hypothetical protein